MFSIRHRSGLVTGGTAHTGSIITPMPILAGVTASASILYGWMFENDCFCGSNTVVFIQNGV